ncbi:MAG: amidohydrolase family protein [Rikenellaceae bacterium]
MISSGSQSYSRRIASSYLLYRGELLRNGVVEVDAVGKILSVGSVERIDSLCNTEFFAGVMFAGMVNAHCHLELSHLKGVVSEQCGFASFAEQLSSSRDSFSEADVARAIAQGDVDMRREGVVAVGDISNSCSSLIVKASSPIHYHTFAEHFGLRRSSSDHLAELLAAPNVSLTPHSVYSVSDRCFRAIASQRSAAPLSIHFMETPSEGELFERRGELWEWYRKVGFECDFLHYGSPARRIVESVPKDRSVMLVHNVSVAKADIELIMNHFSAPVYWVVSPRSNRYISGLKPPLSLLRSMGLNICVGTDSLSSNHSLSMVDELRAMEGIPLVERLEWATKVGAAALNLDHLGEVEVGRRPSLLVLSGVDFERDEIGSRCRIEKIV